MVHGYPKTSLLRIDGARGFVICGAGKSAWEKMLVSERGRGQ